MEIVGNHFDPTITVQAILTLFTLLLGSGVVIWFVSNWRKRKLYVESFPFDVIVPSSKNVVAEVMYATSPDDPLADGNIPYQERVNGRSVRNEIVSELKKSTWVLVRGRTGLGKTRECAEAAAILNRQGWTILRMNRRWLEPPPRFPTELKDKDRKLLFFIDDLNSKCIAGQKEQSPKAENPLEPVTTPFLQRLERTLHRIEQWVPARNVYVLATARDEPKEWDKLNVDHHPVFFQRFTQYQLPEPDDEAIVGVLQETASTGVVDVDDADFEILAARNDGSFANIVENLQRARSAGERLTEETFIETLKGTWEARFRTAVDSNPWAMYVYDAVEVLRVVGLPLCVQTLVPTTVIVAGISYMRYLRVGHLVHAAVCFLVDHEGILHPRDGQIEAKFSCLDVRRRVQSLLNTDTDKTSVSLMRVGKMMMQDNLRARGNDAAADALECSVDVDIHLVSLTRLTVRLMGRYPAEIMSAIPEFCITLCQLGTLKEGYDCARTVLTRAVRLAPDNATYWANLGYVIVWSASFVPYDVKKALNALKKAISLDPTMSAARCTLGELYLRLADAVPLRIVKTSDDEGETMTRDERFYTYLALAEEQFRESISHDSLTWYTHYNLGVVLYKQKRWEDAIDEYRHAIRLNPAIWQIYYNLGDLLVRSCRFSEAADVSKQLDELLQTINPDFRNWWVSHLTFLSSVGEQQPPFATTSVWA